MKKVLSFIMLSSILLQLSCCFPMMMLQVHGNRHEEKSDSSKGTHEVSLSYGYLSGSDWMTALNKPSDLTYTTAYNTGNLFGTYSYFSSDREALGLTIGNQNFAHNYKDPYVTYRQQVNLLTAAIEYKHYFLNSDGMQFYQLLGAGITDRTEHYSNISNKLDYPRTNIGYHFNFQYSYGFKVGKKICWFGELGIGYKGFANTGISLVLPGHKKAASK